ncbi:dephospho-CoA kinase [Alteromonas lipolytica]|uniref:Dephospho-CoA kinase n=1 Tax=Alteromonas lipolytica TaxID=1856405 RepID=A0A1E8FDD7_9ALTE|nr:dephospho-CoA kinase [Alteromonas lipolytica]OFI33940.1 dephospho-CoA kinase [Alteromonas lipolytica]GGF67059.1 dephospho-CoA kinase [Alteromonas lipolytica]
MTARRPFLIGVTGGIGSGKTLVTDTFAELGIEIVDADIVARDVVAPGSPGLEAIKAHFGDSVITESGELNRAALRECVFTNEEQKQWLNACLHPLIRKAMAAAIEQIRSPYGVLAVPLLIENGMQKMVDRIAVVDCPESQQLARALRRDGSSETVIKGIMAAQVSREKRLAEADDIIDNSHDIETTKAQIVQLHQTYLKLAKTHNADPL